MDSNKNEQMLINCKIPCQHSFNHPQSPFCTLCIPQQQKLQQSVPFDQQQQAHKFFTNEAREQNRLQYLQKLLQEVKDFQNKYILSLDNIIKTINNQIEQSLEFEANIISITQTEQFIDNIKVYHENYQMVYQSFENMIGGQFQDLRNNSLLFIDQILINLNTINLQHSNENCDVIEYQIIEQEKKQQINECFAFEFNKENNILIVSCDQEIIVYQFLNGVIQKEMQRLNQHNQQVYDLHFMKHESKFISLSYYHLFIWELDQNNNWIAQTEYQYGFEGCKMLMDQSDIMLIIGGYSSKSNYKGVIQFWSENTNLLSQNQSIEIDIWVNDMSLNEKENTLICCGNDKIIYIIKKQNNLEWKILQILQVNHNGRKITFLQEDKFILQSESDYLELYDFDVNLQCFHALSKCQISPYSIFDWIEFPQIFTNFYVKQVKYLNMFKVDDKGNFQENQNNKYLTLGIKRQQ